MNPRILGVDPSLTSTGIAHIDADGTVRLATITSKPARGVYATYRRIERIAHDVVMSQTESGVGLLVIEGPSFSSRAGQQHERGGLWWSIIREFAGCCEIVVVPPTCRAKYATGKGNAPKDAVLAATVRRYPTAPVADNNQADALILAAMGARWAGRPIDEMPQTHTAAMEKIDWPRVTVTS